MNRNLLDQLVPKSIFTYYRQAMTVLYMVVIAVIFILVFRPFSIYESLDFIIHGSLSRWINSAEDAFYLALGSVVLLAATIIMISRVIRSQHLHIRGGTAPPFRACRARGRFLRGVWLRAPYMPRRLRGSGL